MPTPLPPPVSARTRFWWAATSHCIGISSRLRAAFALPRLRKELERGGLRHPDDLVALTLLGPGEIDAFTVGAEINTDDNALVEFGAPLDLYAHWRYDYFINEVYGRGWSYGRLDEFVRGYRDIRRPRRPGPGLAAPGSPRRGHALADTCGPRCRHVIQTRPRDERPGGPPTRAGTSARPSTPRPSLSRR